MTFLFDKQRSNQIKFSGIRILKKCLNGITIEKAAIIEEITIQKIEWRLEFDLYLKSAAGDFWQSILRVGKGENNAQHGDRCPLISISPNSSKISFFSSVGEQMSKQIHSVEIQLRKWISLKITQERVGNDFYFHTYIDEKLVDDILNPEPREFENLTVWASGLWWLLKI